VRRVRAALPQASERRVCRLLAVPRSSLRERPPEKRLRRPLDAVLVARIPALIRKHPTFGYRKLWALLRHGDGLIVNLKAVYRILAAKRWFVHQSTVTPRPRVQGRRSVAAASNTRWAIDLTHIYCGQDGWGHLAAIIDCHDREIVGFRVQPARTGARSGAAPTRDGIPARAKAACVCAPRAGPAPPAGYARDRDRS